MPTEFDLSSMTVPTLVSRETPRYPVPRTLEEQLRFAQVAIDSGLSLGHRNAASVVMALQMGAEMGFSPMQSLRLIAVVKERPAPTADAFVAAVQASGKCVYFVRISESETEATWETQRIGHPAPDRYTFSIEDARKAKLTGKDNWQSYPKRMLSARCKKFLCQDIYSDVVGGLLSAEEAQDVLGPTQAELDARPSPFGTPPRLGDGATPPVATAPVQAPMETTAVLTPHGKRVLDAVQGTDPAAPDLVEAAERGDTPDATAEADEPVDMAAEERAKDEKAAARGKSPTQTRLHVKRMAVIHGGLRDLAEAGFGTFDELRDRLKTRIKEKFGKEHISEITPTEYAVVVGWLAAMAEQDPRL